MTPLAVAAKRGAPPVAKRRPWEHMSAAEYIEQRIEFELNSGCWLWARGTVPDGYGSASYRGKMGAHRLSWTAYRGDIPKGLWVLHKCDTPACVNPAHLFLGTHAENMADMARKGRGVSPANPFPHDRRYRDGGKPKTLCLRGHPLSPDNLYVSPRGRRECLTCRAVRILRNNRKRYASASHPLGRIIQSEQQHDH